MVPGVHEASPGETTNRRANFDGSRISSFQTARAGTGAETIQTSQGEPTLVLLLLAGSLLLIAAALAILFLRMALDVLEFVCTAVLATVILIFRRPSIGIPLAVLLTWGVIWIATGK